MTRLLRYQLDYNVPCSGSLSVFRWPMVSLKVVFFRLGYLTLAGLSGFARDSCIFSLQIWYFPQCWPHTESLQTQPPLGFWPSYLRTPVIYGLLGQTHHPAIRLAVWPHFPGLSFCHINPSKCPLGSWEGNYFLAYVRSQMNPHMCAKFGANLSSHLADFPHFLISDP